jgi:beta-lactamase class A
MEQPGERCGRVLCYVLSVLLFALGCRTAGQHEMRTSQNYRLDFKTAVDRGLQESLVRMDEEIRGSLGIGREQASIGVLDLRRLRLAMIHPDRGEYAASVPKIAILLAYFELNPAAATNLSIEVRHELGLMVKASSNEAAAKFSQQLGLHKIQEVVNRYGFYDAERGGGIWMGKHYGKSSERYGDPVGDNSHAATVRQLLRFYLLLEQGRLVSEEASDAMRGIFESPEIPHDNIKFVKALAGEDVEIIRKWGSWENWLHDSALVKGDGKHYIIVGLTHHPRGDEYLEAIARAVHPLM